MHSGLPSIQNFVKHLFYKVLKKMLTRNMWIMCSKVINDQDGHFPVENRFLFPISICAKPKFSGTLSENGPRELTRGAVGNYQGMVLSSFVDLIFARRGR